jgi:hypothetical protein
MFGTTQISPDFAGSAQACQQCGKPIGNRWAFAFKAKGRQGPSEGGAVEGQVTKCFSCALHHWPMLKRSLIATLVVGTILTLLNQGDALLSGHWDNSLYWKVPLTYCVPFLVATYGALTNSLK